MDQKDGERVLNNLLYDNLHKCCNKYLSKYLDK